MVRKSRGSSLQLRQLEPAGHMLYNPGSGRTPPAQVLLMEEAFRELFEEHFGEPLKTVAALKGDGSARKLWRLSGAKHTAIGAHNTDAAENRAFIEFSRHFHKCGLPVPEIFAENLDKG